MSPMNLSGLRLARLLAAGAATAAAVASCALPVVAHAESASRTLVP
ncbi:hypothetical protein GRC12_41555, partial [Streptomyces griseorubiginosus]|nr:hypothetical protein [Streptomyces griseorubiginosus]